jgi:hypothetical protein
MAQAVGIGSLPMGDEDQNIPESGLGTAISRLQSMGRNGDTIIAHLTPDEIVVPADILRQNPQVKDMIFAEMRLAGVEDPERCIVGSDENFVNPESGMPEFFLKRIVRGVRNVVKGVGKALKKAAPILLPVAINMLAPGLGTIASGALGAGIGTLVQGGNIKDAFKSALIGGAMGGLYSGVQGGLSAVSAPGGGSFFEGFQSGLGQAGTDFMNTIGMGQPVPGVAPVKPSMASQVRENVTEIASDMPTAGASGQFSPEATANLLPDSQLVLDPATGKLVAPQAPAAVPTAPAAPAITDADLYAQAYSAPGATVQTPTVAAYEPKGFVESLQEGNYREAFLPSGPTAEQVALAREGAYKQAYQQSMQLPGMTPELAAAEATKAATAATTNMGPGLMRSYGPLAAVGTGIAAGAGFFDTPEPDEPQDFFENQKRYADMTPQERAQYQIADLSSGPSYTAPYLVNYQPRTYDYRMPSFFQPVTYAATGGEMVNFPRRNGAINGPGTETSDDVPAMLSDGEFVMTSRAVRGAGNGDREAGVKTMHNLMKAFEMGVA